MFELRYWDAFISNRTDVNGSGERDETLDAAGRLAQVKEKGATMCEPFRSAILWMPDDTNITYDSMSYWVSVPWDNHDGRATLAGDAAHPMTPRKFSSNMCCRTLRFAGDRGQGLNHAICDATNFVNGMKEVNNGNSSLQDTVSKYSVEVVGRGADEVNISKQSGLMMLDWDKLMQSPVMTKSLQKSDLGGSS